MNTDNKINVVVYHDNCMDGFTAAAIATLSGYNSTNRDALLVPGDYTVPVPLDVCVDEHVCFVDYSCSKEHMLKILEVAKSVTVIDHHIGIHADMSSIDHPNFKFVYDVNKSGAQLAWDYFIGLDEPWFVQLIGDRDLWKKEFPQADILNLALRTEKYDIDKIRDLLEKITPNVAGQYYPINHVTTGLIKSGMSYNTYHQVIIEEIVAHAYLAHLDDAESTPVLKVNCPLGFMSDVGAVLAKTSPSGVAWLYYDLGSTVKNSLRVSAASNYDASTYCKTKGGGGHTKAAGWTMSRLPSKPFVSRDIQEPQKPFITNPFTLLNSHMNIGIQQGEFTPIIGQSHSYKSSFINYLYLETVLRNKSMNDTVGQAPTVIRMVGDQNPQGDMGMLAIENKLMANGINTIRIHQKQTDSVDILVLKQLVEDCKVKNKSVQAIFIDDLLISKHDQRSLGETRKTVEALYKFAKDENITILTNVHIRATRKGEPKSNFNITQDAIAAFYDIKLPFDNGLFINVYEDTDGQKWATVTVSRRDPTVTNKVISFTLDDDGNVKHPNFELK